MSIQDKRLFVEFGALLGVGQCLQWYRIAIEANSTKLISI